MIKHLLLLAVFFMFQMHACRPTEEISEQVTAPAGQTDDDKPSCIPNTKKMYAPPECKMVPCIYKCAGDIGTWLCNNKPATEINAKESEDSCRNNGIKSPAPTPSSPTPPSSASSPTPALMTPQSTLPPVTLKKFWSFHNDFSENNNTEWRYNYRENSQFVAMAYNQPSERWTKSGAEFPILGKNGLMHPGNTEDTALSWQAPRAGKIRIKGLVQATGQGCGDGVSVEIMSQPSPTTQEGNTSLWAEESIKAGSAEAEAKYDLTLTVSLAHQIVFGVNKKNDPRCDSVFWNPEVEYL